MPTITIKVRSPDGKPLEYAVAYVQYRDGPFNADEAILRGQVDVFGVIKGEFSVESETAVIVRVRAFGFHEYVDKAAVLLDGDFMLDVVLQEDHWQIVDKPSKGGQTDHYRELLKKYINHVSAGWEGIEISFTEEEWTELRALREEVRNEDQVGLAQQGET